jgi:hypothetical protein
MMRNAARSVLSAFVFTAIVAPAIANDLNVPVQNGPAHGRFGTFGNTDGAGNYQNNSGTGAFPSPGTPENTNGGGSHDTYGNSNQSSCPDCQLPRPHYDSQEVIKTSRDVDHSRTINTESVVEVPAKERVHNHLVIRKNTIRNVGVVNHNHTIIEKEIRYRPRPVYKRPAMVRYVKQQYYTAYQPAIVYVPVRYAVPHYYYPEQPCCQPQHCCQQQHHPRHYYQQHYYQQHHYQPHYYQLQSYQGPYRTGLLQWRD